MVQTLDIEQTKKVRQSNDFIESPYAQEFTTHEIKIFEIGVASITSNDIEKAHQRLNKRYALMANQLASLLNTSVSVISHEIENTAKRIMKKTIHLRKILPDGTVEFEMINIIPYAKYRNGLFEFELNHAIIPYLIEINKNFTEFQLNCLLSLKSSYAIKIYKLLYQYKNIKYRVFTVDEIKNQCGILDKYDQYKNFKQKILIPSIDQINEFTDLHVSFIEHKFGRKVDKIEFQFSLKSQIKISNSKPIHNESEEKCTIDKFLCGIENNLTEKTKKILEYKLGEKGELFVMCSIEYAKKNATTNFEKYLLDTIENNWAEIDIQKLEAKRQAEEIDKQKKQAAIDAKNKELELENANKSEIEHLFIKLTDSEQTKYSDLANNILTKNTDKLKHITAESLSYSVFAVSNGKYYDRKSEVYISKFLKHSLDINSYVAS